MLRAMARIDTFRIGHEIALPELYAQCIGSLRDHSRIVTFAYPDELKVQKSTDAEWSSRASAIRESNEGSLPGSLLDYVNCYAIHTRKEGEEWQLRYVGQTDCKQAKANIMRQLVPHGDRANAVFAKCKDAVLSGREIGLRLIKVEPDTLRYFIQEKLVAELRTECVLDWNRKRF